ncbi:cobalamin B12-binding domain-containing protein [Actinocatenispora rupis]|uniref:Cobalamin-binding protein n=1 Tax=Actinocatenispora rupis TaxID=519421 RepID=A0A8J3JI74_9ACTN|nr:cobalamin-dependent protein [Actinocatenispora rupis]GID15438.1 cobalamin-binding protein [Actinocatenispora rupis]
MTDRERYLDLVTAGAEQPAVDHVTGMLDAGHDAEEVLLDVIAPAQARVGELWSSNEWNVAREHAATYISERAVEAVAARTVSSGGRGHVVVACVDGEWHSLPARILAETLRCRDWSVTFLGSSVPTAHLVTYLHQKGPDAAAISCSLPTRLPAARAAIAAVRAVDVPVVAGGRGFGPDARWAARLGADAWAASARELFAILDRWPPATRADPVAPLLLDAEETLVQQARPQLIDAAWAALRARFPRVADYSAAQVDTTNEDLGHIVDVLAAALLVDDESLFTTFVDWMAGVLGSRHVPPYPVAVALSAIAAELAEFPRARAYLRTARELLAVRT